MPRCFVVFYYMISIIKPFIKIYTSRKNANQIQNLYAQSVNIVIKCNTRQFLQPPYRQSSYLLPALTGRTASTPAGRI